MIKRLIWYPLIRLSSVLRWLVQLGTIVLILLSFRSGPFWSSERSKPIHKLTVAEQNLQTDLRFDLQSLKRIRRQLPLEEGFSVYFQKTLDEAGFTVEKKPYKIDDRSGELLCAEWPGQAERGRIIIVAQLPEKSHETAALVALGMAREINSFRPLHPIHWIFLDGDSDALDLYLNRMKDAGKTIELVLHIAEFPDNWLTPTIQFAGLLSGKYFEGQAQSLRVLAYPGIEKTLDKVVGALRQRCSLSVDGLILPLEPQIAVGQPRLLSSQRGFPAIWIGYPKGIADAESNRMNQQARMLFALTSAIGEWGTGKKGVLGSL